MPPKKLFVSSKDESPKVFENDLLDFFSRVHVAVPIVIYVPAVLILLYRTFALFHVPFLSALLLFLSAALLWTFLEYILHRFVFHFEHEHPLVKRLHFLAHGLHHDYPNDHLRVVMPPGASIPLAVISYFIMVFFLGESLAQPFMAGFTAAYLLYDTTHFAVHHRKWSNPVFKAIQKSHLNHHYHAPHQGYSISVLFWDNVFGTKYKGRPTEEEPR